MAQAVFPVGARWRFISASGDVGEVWLARRHDNKTEIWHYSFRPRGWASTGRSRLDWAPTRRRAVEQCSLLFAQKKPVRFTRIEDHPGDEEL